MNTIEIKVHSLYKRLNKVCKIGDNKELYTIQDSIKHLEQIGGDNL